MAENKHKGMSMEQMAGVGALAAAAAGAAAAGYYFYASEDAPKHRRIAAKWANDLKKDVMKEAKKLKAMDQKALHAIIAMASKKYEAIQKIDNKDIAKAVKELKANWQHLAVEMQKAVKKAKKVAKKVAPKKAAKKSVKKVAKKAAKKK